MRYILALGFALSLVAAQANAQGATVTVAPPSPSLAPFGTQQFQATVTGVSGTSVVWLVNGVPGGAPSFGTISATGLYTAPADVPANFQAEIEAEAVAAPLSNGRATVSVSATGTAGPTFYVSPTGSDSNPGTAAAPWLTIQHAADTVPAGGTALVATGIYNKLVTVTRSGTAAGGFITLSAAPGAAPIIDGTGLAIPNDENGLITLQNASFVRVIGFELRNYTSSSKNLDPVGIYVIGAGDYIELLNNHVHDIATTVQSSTGDALGIAVYGTSATTPLGNVIIDGNELDNLTLGFSESLALSGNVQGFQVTNNLIHDNNNIGIDMAGYEPVERKNLAVDRARDGYVAGNAVFNISSATNPAYKGDRSADGIYVDGGSNIVIERNLVHNTDVGIEAASEHQTNHQPDFATAITIRDNVVYASNIVGITIGGYNAGVGGTQNCVIVNNTLVGDGTAKKGTGELQIQHHASGNVFYNNIADATLPRMLLYSLAKIPNPPALLDYNLYDGPLGSANSQWVWVAKTWTGFLNYTTNTKNDQNGLFADPGFVDAATQNFQLAPGSPARGAGLVLPLSQIGLFDFAGNPRTVGGAIDIGAYQN
jgi:hypothetical protein